MIIQLLLALLLGVLAGTLTGLCPGIHINLVSALLLSSPIFATNIPIQILIIFLVAMAITHTFLDFIPSIFLGAPEEDSFLAVLPGHKLLQEGKAYSAVILTLYGSITALIISIPFIILFYFFLSPIYIATKFIIPYILILASSYLILREDNFLPAGIIFLLSGFLGYLSFNLPIEQPLLPLLTGLFGLSALTISIKQKFTPPKQKVIPLKQITLPKAQILKTSIVASLTAPFLSFLPGMGAGQAAVLSNEIKKHNTEQFLYLLGIINTFVMIISFITIYTIGKTRTGTAAAINSLAPSLSQSHLMTILTTILISGIISFLLGILLAKITTKLVNKLNYKFLSLIIILILIFINTIITNPLGIIVLITATSLGIFTISSRIRRINLMGCLLLPTIIYYLI